MMRSIRIGDRQVGNHFPCFIIAEAGVNHNGDIGLAMKLIDVAKDAGADAVKFQTFKAENVTTERSQLLGYQKRNLRSEESQLAMLKRYELDYADFVMLKKYCDKRKITFLSTPHSEDAVDFLEPLVPAYKVGSGDLTNIPFLEKIARKGKPMFVGTGMSTLNEVKAALKAIRSAGNQDVVMLHCTTNYPCPLDEVNLKAMVTMQKELDCLVGYSDHTLGLTVPIMAATLGAAVIEKHFTLDRNMSGPDHKASLEPYELKKMVKAIRDAEKALGSGIKEPSDAEKEVMSWVRKSIVAKVDIPKGATIKCNMVDIKRPALGLEPDRIHFLIGKKAKVEIKADEPITLGKVI